jgi:hypothetical protein
VRDDLQLSARMVASLLAHIFGPSWYDGPRYGHRNLADLLSGPSPDPWKILGPSPDPWKVAGPLPDPWVAVMLNPQPLPPGEMRALTFADIRIHDLIAADRLSAVFGGEAANHALESAVRLVADDEELCPRWPRLPKLWPPPPPPPPWQREEMTATELFVYGTRFLAAAEMLDDGRLQEAASSLGAKALELSMRG